MTVDNVIKAYFFVDSIKILHIRDSKGATVLSYKSGSRRLGTQAAMDIKFRDLEFELPASRLSPTNGRDGPFCCAKRKPVQLALTQVTGTIRAGSMTIIMGPTNSGKSLLLKLLARECIQTNGTITYSVEHKRASVVYASADDVLLGTDTVCERLMLTARLHTAAEYDSSQIRDLVGAGMRSLGIQSEANTPIEAISYGTRMRLLLADAMLTHPRTLLIDGLMDMLTDFERESMLKTIQEAMTRGVAVVIVTNRQGVVPFLEQDKNDKVDLQLLIMACGRVLFLGHPSEFVPFMSKTITGISFDGVKQPIDYVLRNVAETTDVCGYGTMLIVDPTPADQEADLDAGSDAVHMLPISNGHIDKKRAVVTDDTRLTHSSSMNGHSMGLTYETKTTKQSSQMMDQLVRYSATDIAQAFAKSDKPTRSVTDFKQAVVDNVFFIRIGVCEQAMILMQVLIRHVIRRRDMLTKFIALMWCTMFTCLVWSDIKRDPIAAVYEISSFFFWTLSVTIMTAHANVGYWIDMHGRLKKELARRSYHPMAFILAQSVFSTIETMIVCLFFGLVVFRVLFPAGSWGDAFYFCFFIGCHALSHGALVETWVLLTRDQSRTHIFAMIMLSLSFPLSGCIVPVAEMFSGVSWLSHLSYTFYARSALVDLLLPDSEYVDELLQPIHRPLVSWILACLGVWILCRVLFVLAFCGIALPWPTTGLLKKGRKKAF